MTSLGSRKASRDVRRQQLVAATIEVMGRKGYSGTTMADVAKAAGLSTGIVNFHFETKENLLSETLKFLADEYRANWHNALQASENQSAAHRLSAVLRSDFSPAITDRAKLTAWGAFWGETAARPTYMQYCSANDAEYQLTIERLCLTMIDEGKYKYDAAHVARGFNALTEGLWLDMMTQSIPLSPSEAQQTALACLHAFFPKHFASDGTVIWRK